MEPLTFDEFVRLTRDCRDAQKHFRRTREGLTHCKAVEQELDDAIIAHETPTPEPSLFPDQGGP